MSKEKRTAYIPEVEKMKGLKPGQSAIVKFTGSAQRVEVSYTEKSTGNEVVKDKLHFPILLLSHPAYPHLEAEGNKPGAVAEMVWETQCKEAEQLHGALPELMNVGKDPIVKHYDSQGRWEIQCRDDGKIKLWMLQ